MPILWCSHSYLIFTESFAVSVLALNKNRILLKFSELGGKLSADPVHCQEANTSRNKIQCFKNGDSHITSVACTFSLFSQRTKTQIGLLMSFSFKIFYPFRKMSSLFSFFLCGTSSGKRVQKPSENGQSLNSTSHANNAVTGKSCFNVLSFSHPTLFKCLLKWHWKHSSWLGSWIWIS